MPLTMNGEDNAHISRCGTNPNVVNEIWEEGLARIDGWGQAATFKYNKKAQEKHKQSGHNGKSNLQVPKQVRWRCPGSNAHQRGLSSIGGTRTLLRGEGHNERTTDLTRVVSDLYCSVTPISLIKVWVPLFATPMTIAHTAIHTFVGCLERQATELIWKRRCKTAARRGKARVITARHKKPKYTRPQGKWSYGFGYIYEDDYYPCSGCLGDHGGGICPGPAFDSHGADRTLLLSLLGKKHLGTMERMRRIGF
ncbi:hypothetical protein EDD21DRAFT_359150 [Dissophora ornata]|nr:hypothetical protein EDD21DRAFT_359150 [Dissophora ornata]